VRDPARELAEAFHPLSLQQLRLLPVLAFEKFAAFAAASVGFDVGPFQRLPALAAPGVGLDVGPFLGFPAFAALAVGFEAGPFLGFPAFAALAVGFEVGSFLGFAPFPTVVVDFEVGSFLGFPAIPALVVGLDLGLLPGPALSAQVGHMKSSPELPRRRLRCAGRHACAPQSHHLKLPYHTVSSQKPSLTLISVGLGEVLDAVQDAVKAEDELVVRSVRGVEDPGRDEHGEGREPLRIGQLGEHARVGGHPLARA
jgi:hypothetical protein